jgi:ComF family protein
MKKLLKPYLDIVFPSVCECCGASLSLPEKHLCHWCRHDRFEMAGYCNELIKPNNIRFLYSMWLFDKGGYLQDLLHNLKYNFLKGAGEELGFILGHSFIERSDPDFLQFIEGKNPLLVPVPLHKSKLRKRGYNQAGAIAEGLSRSTGWELSETGCVVRVRKTRTQTGLTTMERKMNLKNAFLPVTSGYFHNKLPIIVDDVFTTGATTYELAGAIADQDQKAGIMTVAMA